MKYYAAFKKKKLYYKKQHDYISVLKGRQTPKTKKIYWIKFKTGKANLEASEWEEHEGGSGGADNVVHLDLGSGYRGVYSCKNH